MSNAFHDECDGTLNVYRATIADLRRLLLESQERERELREALESAANSLQRIGDAVRKPTNWIDGDTLVFELAYEEIADIRAALSRAEGRKP